MARILKRVSGEEMDEEASARRRKYGMFVLSLDGSRDPTGTTFSSTCLAYHEAKEKQFMRPRPIKSTGSKM